MFAFYTGFLRYSNLYYLDPQKVFDKEDLFDYSILAESKGKLNNFKVSFISQRKKH